MLLILYFNVFFGYGTTLKNNFGGKKNYNFFVYELTNLKHNMV